jgi:sugar-phosphatase
LLSALPPSRWAIVTSCTEPLAHVRIRAAGLPMPRFLVTASDIRRGKPDPEPYLRGAELLQLPPTECIVVEDAPAGIRSGKAAGARVLAVRTTTPESELQAARADWVVDDLSKLALRSADERVIVLAI